MASILWTETAQSDLIEIYKFISEKSLSQADSVIDSIIERAQILEHFPEIGKPVKELPKKDYRELLAKNHRIIYRIEEGNIYILTVHHSARLLKNNPAFKDEDL